MHKQNTYEWLQMRKNKIGASDSPPIMGVSPYKTAYQLWEEKLDLSPSKFTTSAMQRGHDLEAQALQELEKITGIFFLPEVKEHKSISYMIASLDGISLDGKCIAEIKCPNRDDHSIALSGQVPEKYFPQLQHQMEVCETEMVHYFSFDGIAGILVKVYRDDRYIKKMLQKEKEFFECMQEFYPPQMTDKDYIPKSEMSWLNASSEWLEIHNQMKKLERKEKELRDSIISMSDKKNAIGGGIKVTRIIRKGNVDYSVIPELKQVELEKYRKNPIECYKISCA